MRNVVLAVCAVGMQVLAGCNAVGPARSDSILVKQMMVNSTTLAYVEEGDGPTVLFIHGAAGDWRNWEGLRPHISPRFRFVSLSRRCHFPNSCNDAGSQSSFDQDVEDIAAFIKAMNVGRVHLVGNSYGGRLVGYVALKYPELLRSVVLGDPSLAAPTTAEGKAAMGVFAKELGESRTAAMAGDDKRAAILLANAVLGDSDGFSKWAPARQQVWLDNAKTIKPMFAGPTPKPVTCDQLKALKVPVLAVRGANTRASYKYGYEALLPCLPQASEAFIVPDAMHVWPSDNPPGAASAILAFLAKY